MLHALLLTAEIVGLTVGALWAVAYGIAGFRRLAHGPDIPEVIDDAFIAKYEARAASEEWLHRGLVSIDICCNVLLRGQPDETMSGRSFRSALEGKLWGRVVTYWLSLFQVQHGVKALVGDYMRAKSRIAVCEKVLAGVRNGK